jgi:Cu(I)/Ag(I) efflux system membrane fusion protein/cobalt-zinc-cadmium efflux system membrane fusion protein
MYATVRIYSRSASDALAIPSEAVIRTGTRKIVFIAREEGKFEPREIRLGAESDDGYVEILSGLLEHEKVVTSGQFLLDSESRTREAIAKMRASQKRQNEQTAQHHHSEQKESEVLYTCPMHLDFITSDPDGRCPECGMKLEKVEKKD